MTPREVILELLSEYPSMSDLGDVADMFVERLAKAGLDDAAMVQWLCEQLHKIADETLVGPTAAGYMRSVASDALAGRGYEEWAKNYKPPTLRARGRR